MKQMTTLYENLKITCQGRKSVRNFAQKEVSAADIEKIKEIAYTSPYASNRKNWELVVVTDRDNIREIAAVVREKANRLTLEIREDLQDSFSGYAENFSAFENAPVLILPTFRISPVLSLMLSRTGGDRDFAQYDRDNYVKSISCVTMLVLLAAQSLGLGSCFMTGPLLAEKEIGELVHIKRGRNIGAVIPIGWPAHPGEPPRTTQENENGD
jgi:nitroreductase